MLEWDLNIALQGMSFSEELLPLDQLDSPHLMIGQLASGQSAQPFVTVEDYENWLKRLEDFAVLMDTARVNLQRGAASGYVLPRPLAEKLLPQLEGAGRRAGGGAPLLQPGGADGG